MSELAVLKTFFDLFEAELLRHLKAFLRRVGAASLATDDLRKMIKQMGGNWEVGVGLSQYLPASPVRSYLFSTLKKGLNIWYHRAPSPWSILDDAVNAGLRLLESLEQHAGNHRLETAAAVSNIRACWGAIERTGEIAMSDATRLTFEAVPEAAGAVASPEVIVRGLPPDTLHKVADLWDMMHNVKVVSHTEGKPPALAHRFVLQSEEQVQTLLANPVLHVRNQQYQVELPEQEEKAVEICLSNVPVNVTNKQLSVLLDLQGNVSIPESRIRMEPGQCAAFIKPASGAEQQELLSIGSIKVAATQVTITKADVAVEGLVYLPTPLTVDRFCCVWDNTFPEVKLAGVEAIDPATMLVKINQRQWAGVEKGEMLIFRKQIRIIRRTLYRVKALLPEEGVSEEVLRAQVAEFVGQGQVAGIAFLPEQPPSAAVIHLLSAKAKSILVEKKFIDFRPQQQQSQRKSKGHTSSSSSSSPSSSSSSVVPQQSKDMGGKVILESVPAGVTSAALCRHLREKGINVPFLTIRDCKAYAELVLEDYSKALALRSIAVSDKEVSIGPFSGDIPWWVLQGRPALTGLSSYDVSRDLSTQLKSRVKVELKPGAVLVHFPDERLFQQVLHHPAMEILGKKVTFADPTLQRRGFQLAESLQSHFLHKNRKDVASIEQRYSVRVTLPGYKAEKKGWSVAKPKPFASPKKGPSIGQPKAAAPTPVPVVEIYGKETANIDSAWQELQEYLTTAERRELEFTFSKDSRLVDLFRAKLRALSKKMPPSETVFIYTQRGPSTVVILLGPADEVPQLISRVEALAARLTFDSSEVLPGVQLPQLGLSLVELGKKYDVFIEHDARTGQLTVAGLDDQVETALEFVRKRLGKASGSTRIKLEEGQAMFVDRYLLPDLRACALDGVKVDLKGNHLQLLGMRERLAEVLPQYQQQLNQVVSTPRTVLLDSTLLPLVSGHLSSAIDAAKFHATFTYVTNKLATPTTAQPHLSFKNRGNYDDDNDDNGDDDDEAEEKTDEEERKERGSSASASVQIVLWHRQDDAQLAKQLLKDLQPTSRRIKFEGPEAVAVKRLSAPNLRKRQNVIVKFNIPQRSINLQTLSTSAADQAERFIRNFIEKGTVGRDEMKLQSDQLKFMRDRKGHLLKDIGLRHGVYIRTDTVRGVITFDGRGSQVKSSRREVEAICQKLLPPATHQFAVSEVNRKELEDAKKELEESYDVLLKIKMQKNTFEVTVMSSEKSSLEAVSEVLNLLRGHRLVIKTEDVDRLWRIFCVEKKVDRAQFEQEWNLKRLRFLKDDKAVEIVARTEEDANQAREALEALLANSRVVSQPFSFEAPYFFHLLNHDQSTFKQQLASLLKTHNVRLVWKNKGKSKDVFIRGSAPQVAKALEALSHFASRLSSALRAKIKKIPSFLANELERKNWKKANEFFSQTGVYINLPDYGTSTVVAELKTRRPGAAPGCIIQVVCGNIVNESVECIVNAANQKLEHLGGVAAKIAKKAGKALVDECAALVAAQGPVPTGSAVTTTSGNLPSPIKAVIHAVGPVWTDGKQQEETLLRSAVKAALAQATLQRLGSISLPAISSGIYGFPKDLCARAIVQAVLEYLLQNTGTSLTQVRLCDNNESVATLLQANLQELGQLQKLQVTNVTSMQASDIELAHQWSWEENNGSFVPFDPDQNYEIEKAYAKQGGKGKVIVVGDLQKQKNGHSYEIDFDAMTELNTHFRSRPRPIRRTPKSIDNVVWEVLGQQGWTRLSATAQAQVELARNTTPDVLIDWRNQQGKLNFAHSTLDVSGTVHQVRRRVRDQATATAPIAASGGEEDEEESSTHVDAMTRIELIGLDVDLEDGERKLTVVLEQLQLSEELSFSRPLSPEEVKQLQVIGQRLNTVITYRPPSSSQGPGLTLKGLKGKVKQARLEAKEHLDKIGAIDHAAYPTTWSPQAVNCELVQVAAGSQEWQEIEARMKSTMPSIVISTIERVQNKWLWKKYSSEKARLAEKNHGNANEMSLYHGTNATAPAVIYNSQDGFDLRYSRSSNMWGEAVYFAFNASYSHGYAYSAGLPGGSRQMFFARVLLGDCAHLAPNNGLRKPPSKTTKGVHGYIEHYDAVSGDHPAGSKVFMIYELGRAYPEYLVTYKV